MLLQNMMNMRTISIILIIALALIPCLPTLAEDNSTVTITMLTDKHIEITLEPTEWNIGDVEPNTEYVTSPTWCTVTNSGNCVVDIHIEGEDAVWVDSPATKWTLSGNRDNAQSTYALGYHIAYDDADSYTIITTRDTQMQKENEDPIRLIDSNDSKQFGLRLLTPKADFLAGEVEYFYGGREMKVTITVSAVVD